MTRPWWEQYVHGYLLTAGGLTGVFTGALLTGKLAEALGPPDPVAGPSLIIYAPLAICFILGLVPAQYWATACQRRSTTLRPQGA